MKSILRRSPLACFIAVALAGIIHTGYAQEYFNPALLEVDTPEMKGTDLSAFEEGSQAPGKYRVDIIINDRVVDTKDIEFNVVPDSDNKDEKKLEPCLSVALLQSYGVKTSLFPELETNSTCANLASIPEASTQFLFGAQKLIISIPQAAMSPMARGYVSPELWDEGITAFLLNYSLSGDSTQSRNNNGQDSNSQYASLRPGLNIGPWRLRSYNTWNRDNEGQDSWESVYTYAQRNIVSLKSQLTVGDSSSPADVFDSIPFRGAQLASDDEMLPDSLRGYAPVVRGIARTNAQVIIRQNGYVIYQSYVSPGAFEITDMYATGGSGDLQVTVKETDGSAQHFIVPFASIPVLQREGHLKYSLTAGRYRSYDSEVNNTPLVQGTTIYGLSHGVTLYGGVQASEVYRSLALGVGKNMGAIGALSADVIQAQSSPKDQEDTSGQSWRIRYSKDFTDIGTNVAIAGFRYSTSGYYDMQEVMDSYGDSSALENRRRNRTELTLSQNLGKSFGSLTGSAIKEKYWNSTNSMASYSLSYNNSWQGITYGISYSYDKNSYAGNDSDEESENDQILSLNVSIPLERFMHNTWANYSVNTSKHGNTHHSVGISGSALEGNALNWNMQQGYGTDGEGNAGSLYAGYHGTYGEVTGGYSYDTSSTRTSVGMNGGVLVHSGGVTLAQPFGETIALVEAPGAGGVSVSNQTGVKTDFRGYTVVSNVSAYRKNDIALNTQTLPDDVELALTSKTVIPTRGAVVRASYQASVGNRVLMTLTHNNGQPVPFGATVVVTGADSAQGFIVGDGGQVYLSGLNNKGTLTAQWGKENEKHCSAPFMLDDKNEKTDTNIYLISGQCS